MRGTQNSTTGVSNCGQDIKKDGTIALVNALTSVEFKQRFKLDHIVRGALNQRLFDESTGVSEQLRLAMHKKAVNRLNKKSAATEHFEVDSVSNKEMLK